MSLQHELERVALAKDLVRELPADVYDTLEFIALMYGGIGRAQFWITRWPGGEPNREPLCVRGMASQAVLDTDITTRGFNPIAQALTVAEIGVLVNDYAVETIQKRLSLPNWDDRVPFGDWCAELGVVRGAT